MAPEVKASTSVVSPKTRTGPTTSTAAQGSMRATAWPESGSTLEVRVVDEPRPNSPEFRELLPAVEHLCRVLNQDELGTIRVCTPRPLEVETLAFSRNVRMVAASGVAPILVGPEDRPLVIDAAAALKLEGFTLRGTRGVILNANRRLELVGNAFPSGSTIVLGGVSGAPFPGGSSRVTGSSADLSGTPHPGSPDASSRSASAPPSKAPDVKPIVSGTGSPPATDGGVAEIPASGNAFSAGAYIGHNEWGEDLTFKIATDVTAAAKYELEANKVSLLTILGSGRLKGLGWLDLHQNVFDKLHLSLGYGGNARLDIRDHAQGEVDLELNVEDNPRLYVTADAFAELKVRIEGLGSLSFYCQENLIGDGKFTWGARNFDFKDLQSQFQTLDVVLTGTLAAAAWAWFSCNKTRVEKSFSFVTPKFGPPENQLALEIKDAYFGESLTLKTSFTSQIIVDQNTSIGGTVYYSFYGNTATLSSHTVDYGASVFLNIEGLNTNITFDSVSDTWRDGLYVDREYRVGFKIRITDAVFKGKGFVDLMKAFRPAPEPYPNENAFWTEERDPREGPFPDPAEWDRPTRPDATWDRPHEVPIPMRRPPGFKSGASWMKPVPVPSGVDTDRAPSPTEEADRAPDLPPELARAYATLQERVASASRDGIPDPAALQQILAEPLQETQAFSRRRKRASPSRKRPKARNPSLAGYLPHEAALSESSAPVRSAPAELPAAPQVGSASDQNTELVLKHCRGDAHQGIEVTASDLGGPVQLEACILAPRMPSPAPGHIPSLALSRIDGPVTITDCQFISGGIVLDTLGGGVTLKNNQLEVQSFGIGLYNVQGPAILRGNTVGPAPEPFLSAQLRRTRARLEENTFHGTLQVADGASIRATGNTFHGTIALLYGGVGRIEDNTFLPGPDYAITDNTNTGGLCIDPVTCNAGATPDRVYTLVDFDGNGCADYPPDFNLKRDGRCVVEGVNPPADPGIP